MPADAGGLIPKNIELVHGAKLAEEFLEFVLKRRTFEAFQQLGYWIKCTTLIYIFFFKFPNLGIGYNEPHCSAKFSFAG